MALGSGQLSLADIAGEYGGSEPHALSEYYGKGNCPASGEIEMHADFQGTSNLFTMTISSNTQQINMATLAASNGWDGSAPGTITINSGVHITTGSPGTAAITTGAWPNGLTILNTGDIHGDGGNAGNAAGGFGPGQAGESAGHGILVTNSTSLSVTNNSGGVIAGGGGGGGGQGGFNQQYGFGGGGGGGRCGQGHTTTGGTSYQNARQGQGGSYSSYGAPYVSNAPGRGGNWGENGGSGENGSWPGGSGGSGGSPVSGSYTLTANNGNMY